MDNIWASSLSATLPSPALSLSSCLVATNMSPLRGIVSGSDVPNLQLHWLQQDKSVLCQLRICSFKKIRPIRKAAQGGKTVFLKRLANTALTKAHHSPVSGGLWHVNLGLTQYSVELCNPLVTFSSSVWRIGPLLSLFSAFLQSCGYPSPVRDLEGMHYEQDTNLLLTMACEERNLRRHHTAFDPYFIPTATCETNVQPFQPRLQYLTAKDVLVSSFHRWF